MDAIREEERRLISREIHDQIGVEGALLLIHHGIPGDEAPLVSVVGGVGPGWWWGRDTGHAGIQGTLSFSLLTI